MQYKWTDATTPQRLMYVMCRCESGCFSLLVQKVKLVSPGKPVWLGETSSAYGGGAVGLSDTFAAGFM